MKFVTTARGLLAFVLVILLAACGGDDGNGGGDSDTGGGADISTELTETASVSDPLGGTLSISYPGDWVSGETEGLITLADEQETLDAFEGAVDTAPELDADDFVVSVFGISSDLFSVFEIDGDSAPTDVIDTLVQQTADLAADAEGDFSEDLNDPEEFTADGNPAALVTGTVSDGEQSLGTVYGVVDTGDSFVLLQFTTAAGSQDDFAEVARAMLGSATLEVEAAATEEAVG